MENRWNEKKYGGLMDGMERDGTDVVSYNFIVRQNKICVLASIATFVRVNGDNRDNRDNRENGDMRYEILDNQNSIVVGLLDIDIQAGSNLATVV